MAQDRRLGFAHLTLDGQLSLHVDVATNVTTDSHQDGGDHEDRRERDNSQHLQRHEHTDLDNVFRGHSDSAVQGLDVLRAARDDT